MLRLIAALLLLAAAPASAQMAPNTITVTGAGSVSVAPDRALVRLGVVTRAATAPEVLRQHEQEVARVLTRVRGFGIADRDIQIEALSLGENYGSDGPDGYRAQRVVTVTLDDLRRVPDLVAAVVTEGANQLQGIDYVSQDTRPAEARALDAAVADARAKAERIASASDVMLGAVVAVEEGGPLAGPPMPLFRRAAAADVSPEPAAYSAGSTEVQATVRVQFSIAPMPH